MPARIGVDGRGVGKCSLKEARDEWDRIRSWSKQNGRNHRELKRLEKQALIQQSSGPTLEQVVRVFESSKLKVMTRFRQIIKKETEK